MAIFKAEPPTQDPPTALTKDEVLSRMKSPEAVLLNVLSGDDFERIHIKGSQNLTLGKNIRSFGISAQRKFKRETYFITYGLNGETTLGLNAAKILVGEGFKADHYPGGLVDWVAAGLPTGGTEKATPNNPAAILGKKR
ncbi:MAG TPA: rhodanese-like domain-containing protein [bacterium]|nr:rhodanese-like domain-containing protein [bacterium]